MKTCTACKTQKHKDEFGRHAGSKDGHAWRCKACASAAGSAWRKKNRARVLAYFSKYRSDNPERKSAWNAVYKARRRGVLLPSTECQWCGANGALDASHGDYRRKLCVLWLCKACHAVRDGRRSRQA